MADIHNEPYLDRFDASKERTKVLYRPDRPLQQSELIEQQSIQEHYLKQVSDGVFKDGTLLQGMDFKMETNDTITVRDGQLYVEGKVRPFNEQAITFTGIGTEKIGVKVVKTVITSVEDPSLLDQTSGVESSMSSGADRLKEEVQLTYNDDKTPTVYEFIDGDLFISPNRPEFSLLNTVLAERTFDESGSYRVNGFELWSEEGDTADKIKLSVDSGVAYVQGYRVHKPSATRIPIPKSQGFRSIIQETGTYDDSVRRSRLSSSSVKELIRVIGRVASPSTGVQMAKGNADGRDSVPSEYTSIDRNTPQVWTDSPVATYTYGADYTILEEDGIQYVDWNTGLNGTEPTTGTTYYISFEYDRQMVEGSDFHIVMEEYEGDTPGWDTFVDFNGMSGFKPINGGMLRFDYDFYLARKDLLVLDKEGNFTVIEGQSDRITEVGLPSQEDPLTLKIGTVLVYPNSHKTVTNLNAVTRLRMEDLQKMKTRLQDLEYNQALQQLEIEATVTDDPLDLRGVFADGFVNFSRMDQNLSSVALSLEDASITLQVSSPNNQKKHPQFNSSSSTAHTWGRIVTAPFIEKREIHQPVITEAWNVNPYAVYNKQGVLALSPSSDNWIEESNVTIENEDTASIKVDRWWAHNRPPKTDNGRLLKDDLVLDDGQSWDMGNSWSEDLRGGRTGTLTTTANNIRSEVIEYIRRNEVSFSVENLQPQSNNLELSFDGVIVPITPTGATLTGSTAGTIRSNSIGEATGKFMIPPNVRTGTREVSLQNGDNVAFTSYTAQGTRKIAEEVITRTRVTVTLYDPLSQSFAFSSDRTITSFGLYFGSKSSTHNLIIQVRGLSEGGYPNRTVYAERNLKPSDVNISEDGSAQTRVYLDDPLMAKAGQSYCVTIITDSNEYTVWVGTLGKPLLNNPSEVAEVQPYDNGVLFSSSNAVTWTAHQKSDLKFDVYTAEFQENAVIEFEPMTEMDADKIMVMATYLTPGNTGCIWEVRIVPESDVGSVNIDTLPWRPLVNYLEQDTRVVVGLAQLKATFRSNRYISPLLALDDLLFINFVTATEGDYVSRNIDATGAPFNTVTMSFDKFTPPGSSITPHYSLDGGGTWNLFTSTPSIVTQSAEYQRYTYTEVISDLADNTKFKIKLALRGENRFTRPRARRLTAVMKDAINN